MKMNTLVKAGLLGATALFSTTLMAEVTQQQVKDRYVEIAAAAYTDSLSTAQQLQAAISDLLAVPNDTNLQAAKDAYKATRAPYQQSEIMRWDTDITLNQNLDADGGPASVDDWEGQVNAWPLDESFIDEIIKQNKVANITTELLLEQNGAEDNEANVTTGVHAIEYLLWGADFNGTKAGAGTRPASDYDVKNCSDTLCAARAQYLKVATELLVDDLTEMQAQWTGDAVTTKGTLAYNFNNSEIALDYILTAIMEMSVGELAGARINSGLETGDTEEEHDCFSDLSHVAIYNNLQGIKNAFYGQYKETTGASISDLIKQKDMKTYNAIVAVLDEAEKNLRVVYDAGERSDNNIRFDQIIGQSDDAVERSAANNTVLALVSIEPQLNRVKQLLSLDSVNFEALGDGD